MVSTDCPLLRYGFRSRSDLSYEYRYLSVDDNGDRPGYANGTFSMGSDWCQNSSTHATISSGVVEGAVT